MKSVPSSPDPRVDEQAALWAARLEGSVLSAQDRIALDAWLAEHPSHRACLSEYCQFSADLEQHLPELVATGAVQMPTTRQPMSRRWAIQLMIGSSLAAAAVVAFLFFPSGPATQSTSVVSPLAQRQAITLADGSRVELNAHTSLQIEIDQKNRHVRLADGEAYFSVTKDPSRPFVVETPSGAVRVTGTVFDVRADSEAKLEVTVVEGSVQVRAGDSAQLQSPVMLHPNEQLSSNGSAVQVATLSPAELNDALAWREGQIVFAGTPMQAALARFARYHGRGITIDPDVAQLPVGGRFNLDDLNGFFNALELAFPVQATRELNGVIHVSRRTERP
jgi:transmembrane sensor